MTAVSVNEKNWMIYRHLYDDLDKEELEAAAIPVSLSASFAVYP